MKIRSTKKLFFALLFFSMACLITACSKTAIKPNTFIDSTRAKNDSTLAADTLPSFYSPSGIAVDASGNLYVADYGNNLIRKITPAGIVSTLAGTGFEGSVNAAGNLASFNGPSGIAVDAAGNIYIADSGNNLIRKIDPSGTVSTLAGRDTTGAVNGPGANASFFDPLGVAIDANANIYVADAGNNLIRLITPSGIVSTFAGTVNSASSNVTSTFSALNNPTGLAVDGSGNVFVANYLNNTILQINQSATISILAGTGQQGAGNGPGNSATFYYPNNVAVDQSGDVYVSDGDNNVIREITPSGVVSTLAGSGTQGSADGTGTNASFNGPAGLAVDALGNVYVADAYNNLIRKITPAGVVSTVAGNVEPGSRNGKAFARRNRVNFNRSTSKRNFNIWFGPKLK